MGLDAVASDGTVLVGELPNSHTTGARVRAIARRGNPNRSLVMSVGNLSIDLDGGGVSITNVPLALRRREFLILQTLAQRAGRVVTRDVLIEALYGFDDLIESNTLEAQISRLRRKLRDATAEVEISSLRGLGYILRKMGPSVAGSDVG